MHQYPRPQGHPSTVARAVSMAMDAPDPIADLQALQRYLVEAGAQLAADLRRVQEALAHLDPPEPW